MVSRTEIIQIALNEHDQIRDLPPDVSLFTTRILDHLDSGAHIPHYGQESPALSLVTFNCMLQDTGYPTEVYLPPGSSSSPAGPDYNDLRERWVGWAVELPGAQEWAFGPRAAVTSAVVPAVKNKFPLPDHRGDHLGALLKIYGDTSYSPSTLVKVTGVVSSAALPGTDGDSAVTVPTIHVLLPPESVSVPSEVPNDEVEDVRSDLIDYVASAFSPPDRILAELLLLHLISHPVSRPTGTEPLGTLSLNIITQSDSSALINLLRTLAPLLVDLPLSIPLLQSQRFIPHSSDSTSLEAGLLQLGEGTVLAIQESAMGEGGQLNETGLKNLQALIECARSQTLQFEYPFMDDLRMPCAIRMLVFSEAKSLVPVDIRVPLSGALCRCPTTSVSREKLCKFRSYLACQSKCGPQVTIPDSTAESIQEAFVESRQNPERLSAESAADTLKRRLKLARVLAQSHKQLVVTSEVWSEAVLLDDAVDRRFKERYIPV